MTQLSDGADRLSVRIDDRVAASVPDYVLGLLAVPAIEVGPAHPAVADRLTAAEDALHRAPGQPGSSELPASPAGGRRTGRWR
nr:hypothetical protein [Micromonospora provocatoris]